jgi:hypothetical protein
MYVTHPSANPGIDGFVSVISKDDLWSIDVYLIPLIVIKF